MSCARQGDMGFQRSYDRQPEPERCGNRNNNRARQWNDLDSGSLFCPDATCVLSRSDLSTMVVGAHGKLSKGVHMRHLSVLLFIALPCGAQMQPEPQQTPVPFSIAITGPTNPIRLGSPIVLKLVLTNTSQKGIGVLFRDVGPGYGGQRFRNMDIRVVDSSDKPVEETDLGMTIHGRNPKVVWGSPGKRGAAIGIGPGQTLTEQAELNKEFDLRKPGIYTVQAQRWDGEHGQMVLSNKVTITITQ